MERPSQRAPIGEAGLRRPFAMPLLLVSDEALASRVRAGDERSFDELYARYRDRLFRYCASILRQPQDAGVDLRHHAVRDRGGDDRRHAPSRSG